MNLLHIHWGFIVGGGSRYTQTLILLLKELCINSHLLLINDPRWQIDEEGLNRIEHKCISINGRLDFSWIRSVAEHIQSYNPDLIMTHGFNAHFVALMAQRKLNKRLPIVCSYHGPYHAENLKKVLLGFAYERFTEYFFRKHALAVVTVANHARMQLIKRGIPSDKITVIHNAVKDLSPQQPATDLRLKWRLHWNIKDDDILIGAVGRLDPIKGQKYLIRAFRSIGAQYKSVKLIIIGDGPERARLETLIRKSPFADRIIMAGNIPNADQVLPAFDIYVLPSLSECHSIALLEAMRSGLPIIATLVGGNSESIINEREGLIIPPGDSGSLAAALIRLLMDNTLCNRLGRDARERYLRDFTQDVMFKKTAAWFMTCLALSRRML